MELLEDRTTTGLMRSNQMKLYFSRCSYLLLLSLWGLGLRGTKMERAQGGTIRLKLLRIGTLLRILGCRVVVALTSEYPKKDVFARAHALPTG